MIGSFPIPYACDTVHACLRKLIISYVKYRLLGTNVTVDMSGEQGTLKVDSNHVNYIDVTKVIFNPLILNQIHGPK